MFTLRGLRAVCGKGSSGVPACAGLCFALLALMMAIPPYASAGKVYQWKDASGVVHFSDNPDDVPAKHRASSQREVAPLAGTVASSGGLGAPSGREVWVSKCQACHVYTSDIREEGNMGIFSFIINPQTRFPFADDVIFTSMKNAASGFGEGMPAVQVSDEELKSLTRFLVQAVKP